MKRTTWIVLGWLVLGIGAQAASFDCAKAATKVEKLICGDAEISKLDEELYVAYKAALKDEKQADSIKQVQKQWMKERNGCVDAACVKRTYEVRLKTLSMHDQSSEPDNAGMIASTAQIDRTKAIEQAFPQTSPKLRYAFCDKSKQELYCEGQTGKGYTVCETYLKHLQTLTSPPTCEAPIPPGFKQPDWEEMDITQHLDLAYQAEGLYLKKFGGYKHPDFEAWRQTFLQEINEGKINPRMRKAKVTPNDKGEAVILAYTRDRDACHKIYGTEEQLDAKTGRRIGRPSHPYWSSQGNAGQLWASEQGDVHFILPRDTPNILQVIVGDVSRMKTDLRIFSGRPYFVRILRGYLPLYKNHDEQMLAGAGLFKGLSVTWIDSSAIVVYTFDPRFPDKRPSLDLNHYLADMRCQFIPN